MDEPESKEEFVVRDRRRVSADGKSSASAAPEENPKATEKTEAAEKPKREESASREQAPPTEEAAAQEEAPPKPLDFATFILSMANSALFHLGYFKMPDTESHKDLVAARQTIDLIALLEEKTKGNLTSEEEKIVKETLFQLRMAFVEASK